MMNEFWRKLERSGLTRRVERIIDDYLTVAPGPRETLRGECIEIARRHGLQSREMLRKIVELQRDRLLRPGLFTELMTEEARLRETIRQREEESMAAATTTDDSGDSSTSPEDHSSSYPWDGIARTKARRSRKLPFYPVLPQEAFHWTKTPRLIQVAKLMYNTYRTPDAHRAALYMAGIDPKWYDHFVKRIARHGESYGWKLERNSRGEEAFVLDW